MEESFEDTRDAALAEQNAKLAARVADAGQAVVDQIDGVRKALSTYIGALMSTIDPSDRNGAVALMRVTKGCDVEIDFDNEVMSFTTLTEMSINVEESMMWAAKAFATRT